MLFSDQDWQKETCGYLLGYWAFLRSTCTGDEEEATIFKKTQLRGRGGQKIGGVRLEKLGGLPADKDDCKEIEEKKEKGKAI